MNIEELKLILDTVATVSDDAKSIAIWYIVLNYGASFVLSITALIGFMWTALAITKGILKTNEWAKVGVKLSYAWGGYSSSQYSDPNDRMTVNAIDKCLSAAKEHSK